MAKFTIVTAEHALVDVELPRGRRMSGALGSQRLSPGGYSLWLMVSDLSDGATVSWTEDHGDDAVYVLAGEIRIGARTCPAGGAVIVEDGVVTEAVSRGISRIAHFGTAMRAPTDGLLGPVRQDNHTVHVMDADSPRATTGDGIAAFWFADSTCPTCRVTLVQISGVADRVGPTHSHSQDEIIFLLSGSIRLGAYELRAGDSLCMPGDVRYAVKGGPDAYRFLNFRRDVSVQTNDRATSPFLEVGR